MNRRQTVWLVASTVLALLAAATAPAFPRAQGDTDPAPPRAGQDPSRETVEQILEEQEQLLRGQRFIYDPGNRRDPFLSLHEPRSSDEQRPSGIEGMALEEIDLTGIVENSGGNVAYFTGSDNKGYFLRVGQRIYKATMITIDPKGGSVTFRQEVDDPRNIKPYRDVVRKLVPLDEESGR